jgi:hypothetical protein
MKSLEKVRKTDIYKALLRMGLIDVTTERQEKNGTIALFDTESGAKYTFTAAGYYRREYLVDDNPYKDKVIYQLNPREDRSWGSKITVAFPGEYKKMMTLALGPIYSYRKSTVQGIRKTEMEWATAAISQILNAIAV